MTHFTIKLFGSLFFESLVIAAGWPERICIELAALSAISLVVVVVSTASTIK